MSTVKVQERRWRHFSTLPVQEFTPPPQVTQVPDDSRHRKLRVVTGDAAMQYNPLNTFLTGRVGMAQSSPETGPAATDSQETEILFVVIQRDGKQVSAKWGLHPNLKEELKPEEWKELTEVMGKVTTLVGGRFSQVLTKAEEESGGTA
ncbi:MAG TPA: hypothetical protein PKK23_16870 [Nitrospirales bacterium]|nr:hypothetical protein [Nitrospirales bacterium]